MSTHDDQSTYQNAQFAELRSLLQGAPDPERWEELCRLVQAWRGEAFADIEPYIQEHLSGWSDEVRIPPKRWKSWLFKGLDVPQLRLTRTLAYSCDMWVPEETKLKSHARLATLLACPDLCHIKHLHIEGATFGPAQAEGLAAFARNHHGVLEAVALNYSMPTPEAAPLWADALSALRVRHLKIGMPSESPVGALAMLATTNPLTETLKQLDLGYSRLAADAIHVLSTSPALSGLEGLTHWSGTYYMPEIPRALAASTTLPEHIRDFFRHRI